MKRILLATMAAIATVLVLASGTSAQNGVETPPNLSRPTMPGGPPTVPQNQMGAAALVLGQVLLIAWTDATVQVIDDTTAHVRGHLGILPPPQCASGCPTHDAIVTKLDDCHFQATNDKGKVIGKVDLSAIGTQYRQDFDYASGSPRVTFLGDGSRPALCRFGKGQSDLDCFWGLELISLAAESDQSLSPALRAVQFLQQSCPPARLGF